jgi:hypothetical protein
MSNSSYVRISNFEFKKIDENVMDIKGLILEASYKKFRSFVNVVIEFNKEFIKDPKLFFQKHKTDHKDYYKEVRVLSLDEKIVFIIAIEEKDYFYIYEEFR